MSKRISCRAIIFRDNKLVSMYREKNDRVYYTFPGGGIEENETKEECVVREVFEEFGIKAKPKKLVYTYEDAKTVQYFYVCEWISGNLGEGEGEEFQEDRGQGVYIPSLIDLAKLPNLPLMPPQVASQLYSDFSKNGESLREDVKPFIVE